MSPPQSATRSKLLAAAEQILVQRGITGLSVRKVGDVAGLNPTLVTYHFGSLGTLLEKVRDRNLEPILAAWEGLDQLGGLDDILRGWLGSLLMEAAFTAGGRALVVIDEISSHAEGGLGAAVIAASSPFSRKLRALLLPLCPELDEAEMRARIRFISAAALGPPPRGRRMVGVSKEEELEYLVRFAHAALRR
ncbi:TetR/AcrR family transcriptional regulator [Aurantiacibacter suaedae]|uniref:TetR/AcrR family transcriptional regulator n=1 Tax=Aurantiacibacter suaedae TaxID=2545755 RepID=UPI0010F45CD2|nr:TetR/AcrR family transcriptional regulator [Aurantiacibacter suaedae]